MCGRFALGLPVSDFTRNQLGALTVDGIYCSGIRYDRCTVAGRLTWTSGWTRSALCRGIISHRARKLRCCVKGTAGFRMGPVLDRHLGSSCIRCAGVWYRTGQSTRTRTSIPSTPAPRTSSRVGVCGVRSKERNDASCSLKGVSAKKYCEQNILLTHVQIL